MAPAAALACALAVGPRALAQEPLRGIAAEVWAAERRHWELLARRDLSEYMRYYHRDYVGWPHFAAAPVDKPTLGTTPLIGAEGDLVAYELSDPVVRVFGGAAVSHYLVRLETRGEDGTVERRLVRYSRTWVRVDRDWIIMTETSALVER